MLQELATREADELSKTKKLCTFVDFYIQYAFKNESVVIRYKSFRFIAKFIAKKKQFFERFLS